MDEENPPLITITMTVGFAALLLKELDMFMRVENWPTDRTRELYQMIYHEMGVNIVFTEAKEADPQGPPEKPRPWYERWRGR